MENIELCEVQPTVSRILAMQNKGYSPGNSQGDFSNRGNRLPGQELRGNGSEECRLKNAKAFEKKKTSDYKAQNWC